jgi:CRISPR-associated endonuclease Cas1 subtype II
MSWRTVIISTHAKLDLQSGFMVVRTGDDTQRVLLDEIDILLIENTAVSVTAYLLAELVARKVRVIFCDCTRNPLAELHPCHGCHDVTRKGRQQLAWPEAHKQAVWQRIVQEKIRNQIKLLERYNCIEQVEQLAHYEGALELDDSSNREGHAAKVYFSGIFGNDFKRSATNTINSTLDYGYMILLAVFNRALVAEGLLTQFGLAHKNIYNQWNLSCDLIEPFRPLIDKRVVEMTSAGNFSFNTDAKRTLVRFLHEPITIDGKRQSLINAVTIYILSVIRALTNGDITEILFPEW